MTTEGIKALVEIGNRSFKLKRRVPIICTCNEFYAKCLKPLTPKCISIRFWPPKYGDIRNFIIQISSKIGITVPLFVLNEMASMTDFRQIVTFFDYYCRNKPDFSNAEDIKSSTQRDKSYTLYDGARKLLEFGGALAYKERESIHSDEPLISGMIQQNYPRFLSSYTKKNANITPALLSISESLSFGDIVEQRMQRSQNYSLWGTVALGQTITPSFYLNQKVDIKRNYKEKFDFPENISKGGMIQRNVDARKEVLKRLNIGGEDPLDIFFAKVILEEKEMHGDGVDYQSLHDLRPEDFDVIEKCSETALCFSKIPSSYGGSVYTKKVKFKTLREMSLECTSTSVRKKRKSK